MTKTGKNFWSAIKSIIVSWKSFLNSDDDTIFKKMTISVFDKIILGGLLFFVAYSFQNKQTEYQRKVETVTKLVNSYTESTSKLRVSLLNEMSKSLSIIDEMSGTSMSESEVLDEIAKKIRTNISNVEYQVRSLHFIFDYPAFEASSNSFIEKIQEIEDLTVEHDLQTRKKAFQEISASIPILARDTISTLDRAIQNKSKADLEFFTQLTIGEDGSTTDSGLSQN